MDDELFPYFINPEIIQETAQQIIKDFGMTGIEIRFSGDPRTAYTELFDQVSPQIERLLSGNTGSFYNLLYRIDISESQLKQETARYPDKGFPDLIAHLIIKRELQKVVIRKKLGKP